jgi:hypothetical protein
LLTSLALITAIHFSERQFVQVNTFHETMGSYVAQWFFISFIIGGLVMLKLGLASLISLLFAWRDTAGFQFFNFVRVLVLSLSTIGAISILGFSLGINVNYYFLVKCFCGMLSLSSVLLFFKLLNRESTNVFHLFCTFAQRKFFR